MEKENRPWGWYETLQQDVGYKVKRLYLEPEQKISLQYHTLRNEHWIIVNGNGQLELDEETKEVRSGDYIFISSGSKHRITAGINGITIIEIQSGSICEEDDIVRLEDCYGRI